MDIMGFIGPWLVPGAVAVFIFAMTQRKGWKWPQIIAGMLFLASLYGNFPSLNATVYQDLKGIVQMVTGQ